MFDRLVESTAHHADSARKGWFFLGTFSLYFVLFLALLVVAIKAYDSSLTAQNLADMKLITKIAEDPVLVKPAVKPEEQPKAQAIKVETQVATAKEPATTRPEAATEGQRTSASPPGVRTKGDRDFIPTGGSSTDFGQGTGTGPPVSTTPPPVVADEPPPPPQPTPKPVPRAPISGGVLNGKALSLPKPPYPPIAKAAHAAGVVTVQVTIDESGKVISAKAVSGHPLLQQAAVQAAYGARFTPTQLSGQPVKVTGVITYNFVAQ